MRTFFRRLVPALLLCVAVAARAPAQEEILYFDVTAQVNADASLTVTEELTFRAEGNQIRRGIIRALPVKYYDENGKTVTVGMKVLSTTVDGKTLKWSESREGRGLYVRIGNASRELARGIHTLTLTYRTTKQLGFYENHDELYWNVTGNDWDFPIRSASFKMALPDRGYGEDLTAVDWFVGSYGSTSRSGAQGTTAGVSTTRALRAGEGLTVAFAWPKGIVAEPEPSASEKFAALLEKNASAAALALLWVGGIAGALLIIKAASAARKNAGNAPVVIPLFHAPQGLTPSLARWAIFGGADAKSLSAEIIALAVQGYLKISGDKDDGYTIENCSDGKPEPQGYLKKRLLGALFSDRDNVHLNDCSAEYLLTLRKIVQSEVLSDSYGFVKDASLPLRGAYIVMLIASVAAAALCIALDATAYVQPETAVLSAFTALVSLFSMKGLKQNRSRGLFKTLLGTYRPLLPVAFIVAVSGTIADVSIWPALALAVFGLPLKNRLIAWSPKGRETFAGAKGLEMYITTAEKERLEMLGAPDDTPSLFEELLPYAVALDCAKTWADRFEKVLAAANYHPTWYASPVMNGMYFSPIAFASTLTDLSRGFTPQLATTMTAPGRHSAFGGGSGMGGGFSGGGGGGGGGRGW